MGYGRSPMDVAVESTIKDIITANYEDLDSVLSRGAVLQYDLLRPHRVIVGIFKQDIKAIRGDLIRRIQADIGGGGLCCCIGEEMVILLQSGIEYTQTCETVLANISAQFRLKIYLGVGSIASGVDQYASSYQAARKALDVGAYMATEGQIYSFDQFKVHALFLSSIRHEELYAFAREQLCALIEYDETNHTKLCVTLQEFLYLHNNIESTARSLSLSVSGLKYRLRKAESILGIDLHNNKTCFDIQLAFVIMQLFGEYPA